MRADAQLRRTARRRCRVCRGALSGSEWFSTEQPVRHNTGHQQSLPHTGYQHGTALGTRSVLLETSSKPGSGQTEKRGLKIIRAPPGWYE